MCILRNSSEQIELCLNLHIGMVLHMHDHDQYMFCYRHVVLPLTSGNSKWSAPVTHETENISGTSTRYFYCVTLAFSYLSVFSVF